MKYQILSLAMCLLTTPLIAQSNTIPEIRVHGNGKIERLATHLRMQVDVVGVGRDLSTAMQSLKTQQQVTKENLLALQVTEKSIHFAGAKLPKLPTILDIGHIAFAAPTSDQDQVEELPPTQCCGDIPSPLPILTPVDSEKRVLSRMMVDFPIHERTSDEIFVEVDAMKENLGKLDLSGVKAIEAAREERKRSDNAIELPCLCGLGELSFQYVCLVSDEDFLSLNRQAALDANRKAKLLSIGADVQLGSLSSLTEIKKLEEVLVSEESPEFTIEAQIGVTYLFASHSKSIQNDRIKLE